MTQPWYLPRERFQDLLETLKQAGYRLIGPRLRDGAISYERFNSVAELPSGVHDRQGPGEYRVELGNGPRYFAWANGPQALKPYLFTPREVLWRAERKPDGSLAFSETPPGVMPTAVIGARACDLAALRLQDQHFLEGPYPDPYYQARRRNLFIVAINCSHPADTCFCASTGDGPEAQHGYDLALTELEEGFVVHVGCKTGQAIIDRLPLTAADEAHCEAEAHQAQEARLVQRRRLPGRNLRDALFANLEHPRWDEVAGRCLSCGNCTSVCPTCFCHSETEHPSLDGTASEHMREWDSCFTQGHSYLHGYQLRPDTRTRYRQWLTHKLGSWHDQYGRSGCVGCGRCITWCPVGIDITEEATAICGDQQ